MSELVKLVWTEPKHTPMMPMRGSDGASGFDLQAFGEYELKPFEPQLIRTGWQIEIGRGFEGQVRPRSGLALKHGVTILNSPGTIDCDYRGEVGAIMILLKHGKPFTIRHGERIAQLVIVPVYIGEIEIAYQLSTTARGVKGYGSTGV
jgi:dUTP pyrophosphatase